MKDKAPFDGILAAAAPSDVPQELLDQLSVGGRLVIPIGEREQKLYRITRTEEGFQREFIEDVRFIYCYEVFNEVFVINFQIYCWS